MISFKSHFVLVSSLLVLSFSACWAAYGLDRSAFGSWLGCWSLLWLGAIGAAYGLQYRAWGWLLLVGLGLRLLGLGAVPALSDDYFRFLWDGRLAGAGYNPFGFLPSELLNEPIFTKLNLAELYNGLNSPNYYSVYPPVSQLWFYLSAAQGQSLAQGLFWLHFWILLAELGSFFLLYKLLDLYQPAGRNRLFWLAAYWLNPLVIVELNYNLHFEAVQGFFLLLCLYLFENQKFKLSSLAYGLAAAAKLLPLLFAPLLFFRLPTRAKLGFVLLSAGLFLLGFIPFFDYALWVKIGSSVGLYFKSFEFNGSVYYLARELGFWVYGYNQIGFLGRFLPALAAILALYWAWKGRNGAFSLPELMLRTLFGYYLLATTVHPWYVCNLLPLAVLAGRAYPVGWSCLVFLSYHSYQNPNLYQENLLIVGLEYGLLAGFFWYEFAFFSKNRNQLG